MGLRRTTRIALLVALLLGLFAVFAPASYGAEFGIKDWFAGNCKLNTCGEGGKRPTTTVQAKTEGFQTSAGDVPYGVTDFVLNTTGTFPAAKPVENVKNVRVDVAPGVVTNPQAVPMCKMAQFEGTKVEFGGKIYYTEPKCQPDSQVGVNKVVTEVEGADVSLEGPVYNLEQPKGLASDFGVAVNVGGILWTHTFIEGNVEWATDYHDYFEIHNVAEGLIESRLEFFGTDETVKKLENYGFLRNPSACVSPKETATTLTVESYGGQRATETDESLVGTTECNEEPFAPTFSLTAENALPDAPDAVTEEVTLPHPEASETDSSNLKTATVTLPEGLTMNPSAGAGLEGCTPEQIGIGTRNPTKCPSGSRIGTVTLEVPTLPPGSLQGFVFLGKPAGKPIEGPPYTIYIDAESAYYGVKVRLEGRVEPNPQTGRLTAVFEKNPEQPFNSIALHFSGGAFAPLANPLVCGSASLTSFTPFSGTAAVNAESPFALEGCLANPPFAPTQSTSSLPASGGANTNFAFTLTRPEGEQYVEKVKTILPSGLVGKIPTVTQCAEAAANAGTCPSSSLIGSVSVAAGSGEPFPFNGNVYLTGPYEGAPYGLSFVVPVVAGPFNLGTEVKRAKIEVEPYSDRVIVTTSLPTIRDGIPTRIRSLNVSITRPNYMINPTSCAPEEGESLLRSTLGAETTVKSSFQAEGCSALSFKPKFTASTSGRPTKAGGASLLTTVTQGAGQANIQSVFVTLPIQLPSRDSTLNKACLAATFEANPAGCPKGSRVGSATAVTPLLPEPLKGTAFYISHGGVKFPDLDVVLEGDHGIRTILVGKTKITKGITTTNFAATPDVPVSSFTLNLPMGPYSALDFYGSLCRPKLLMPTVITGWNGKQFKQNTLIQPSGCGVQILSHKVRGNTAYVTVKTFAAGRVSGSGSGLHTVYHKLNSANGSFTIKVPLSSGGLARHRPFDVRLRIGFKASRGHNSQAFTTVRFG